MSKFKIVWLLFLLIISFPSHAQQLAEVKGRITNTSNEPIPGATILLSSTKKGAKADRNGFFKISGISFGNHQVTISAVGYQT
ncbi:carboxypeptidase-like regulatory domain-containing protein, partial [Sphingobacterium sp.]